MDRGSAPECCKPNPTNAKANVRAGEVDEALKWLDEAIAVRDTQIVYTPIVPGFEPLWDHPRFRSILGKLAGTSPGCCWRGARARRLRSND